MAVLPVCPTFLSFFIYRTPSSVSVAAGRRSRYNIPRREQKDMYLEKLQQISGMNKEAGVIGTIGKLAIPALYRLKWPALMAAGIATAKLRNDRKAENAEKRDAAIQEYIKPMYRTTLPDPASRKEDYAARYREAIDRAVRQLPRHAQTAGNPTEDNEDLDLGLGFGQEDPKMPETPSRVPWMPNTVGERPHSL